MIFAEAGRLRVLHKNEPPEKQSWNISAPWRELAHQCRMTGQLEHRNYRRVQKSLLESAHLAQSAQIISSYSLEDETFTATFDNRIFDDLDEYLSQQREKQKRRQAKGEGRGKSLQPHSVLWKDRSRYSLTEINKLIEEHEEALKTIRNRIHYAYNVQKNQSTPDREFTPEEQERIEHHKRAISELKGVKFGYQVP